YNLTRNRVRGTIRGRAMLSGWRWQFVWPVLLATGCLVGLCTFVAVSLFHQQTTLARALHGDLRSRRAAVELEECLNDLLLEEQQAEVKVEPLHARAREH